MSKKIEGVGKIEKGKTKAVFGATNSSKTVPVQPSIEKKRPDRMEFFSTSLANEKAS